MTKQTLSRPARRSTSDPASDRKQRAMYTVFGIIIVALVLLIGWLLYVLLVPDKPTVQDNSTNAITQTNTGNRKNNNAGVGNKNKNTNADKNTNETANANTNKAGGLVEPEPEDNANTNAAEDDEEDDDKTDDDEADDADERDEADDDDNDDEKTTVTLYFPKAGSGCGEVYPVEREVELGDDIYGDTLLMMMAGPTEEESGYTDGVPSSVHLREVRYTAEGPLVTVNEEYDALESCSQQTVEAQFIQTSNAMFDLPVDGSGEVVAGEVPADDTESEDAE